MKKCPDCAELVQVDARVCRFCRHEFAPPPAAPTSPPNKVLSGANVVKAADSKGTETKGKGCLVAGLIGVIVLFGVILGGAESSTDNQTDTAGQPGSAEPQPQPARTADKPKSLYADAGRQIAWVSSGKESIKEQLKDPDSAQFRNVHFYSGGGTPVVCGEVNARNAFGGYTGYERFVAAGTIIAATESQVQGGLGPVWEKFCVKAPHDRI